MDAKQIKGDTLMIFKKIWNKIYTYYLRLFYRTLQFNEDVIVDYRCEIEQKNNISIGKKSILYKNITIYKQKEGYLDIGEGSHIAPYGYFLIEKQKLTIGDNVAIGPFCSIFCSTNAISGDENTLFKDSYTKGDVNIGNNVFIGTHCIILPNTIIEDNVVIAANSTLKGRLKSGYLYGGNPAVEVKAISHA